MHIRNAFESETATSRTPKKSHKYNFVVYVSANKGIDFQSNTPNCINCTALLILSFIHT